MLKKKNKKPLYVTMPALNGNTKSKDGTDVKIPDIDAVELLKDFSSEHKM